MTELILANPTLTAIAFVGIVFALLDAINSHERSHLRVVMRRRQRRGADANLATRLPRHDRWR